MMIFDRRPFYLICSAIAVAIVIAVWFLTPHVTPEQRVREQLAVVASEPWVRVQIHDVQFVGSAENPSQVLVRAHRAADGSPITVQFVADSPYTSSSALRRLTESPLEGRDADIKMVPRSIVQEKFRGVFQADATHAGVAIFADFAVAPDPATLVPAVVPPEPSSEAMTTPVPPSDTTAPAATPAQPTTPPATAAASTTGG
jgi:DNA-binding transcriptional LysR family regulator